LLVCLLDRRRKRGQFRRTLEERVRLVKIDKSKLLPDHGKIATCKYQSFEIHVTIYTPVTESKLQRNINYLQCISHSNSLPWLCLAFMLLPFLLLVCIKHPFLSRYFFLPKFLAYKSHLVLFQYALIISHSRSQEGSRGLQARRGHRWPYLFWDWATVQEERGCCRERLQTRR